MEQQHQPQQYTCPMHPEIVQDKSGNCSKCGMNLVPVKGEADKSASPHQQGDSNPSMGHAGHTMPTGRQEHSEMANADLNKAAQSFQRYTCPMHPQIVQDAPG